jgi:hypothetical protein
MLRSMHQQRLMHGNTADVLIVHMQQHASVAISCSTVVYAAIAFSPHHDHVKHKQ